MKKFAGFAGFVGGRKLISFLNTIIYLVIFFCYHNSARKIEVLLWWKVFSFLILILIGL